MIQIVLLGLVGWGVYSYINKKNAGNARALPEAVEQAMQEVAVMPADAARTPVLHSVIQVLRQYGFTPEDVARAWDEVSVPEGGLPLPPVKAKKSMSEIAMQVFGYLGGVFVFSGLGVYITSFWDDMGSLARVIITLGVGWVLNVILLQFLRNKSYPRVQIPLLLLSALMQTTGWFVFIYEYFPHGDEPQKAVAAVCAVMAMMQAGMFYSFRSTWFVGLALFYFYGLLQAVLSLLDVDWQYAALLLGASLYLVGDGIKKTPYAVLCSVAYFFGGVWFNAGLYELVQIHTSHETAAVVAGAGLMSLGFALRITKELTLSGWAYFFGSTLFYLGLFDWVNHTVFEFVYFGVIIAMIYACTLLQSRALLFTSVCALLGYIGYYSAEYFVDSIGWPLALVLMGFAFFGVAMMAVRVKKRIRF